MQPPPQPQQTLPVAATPYTGPMMAAGAQQSKVRRLQFRHMMFKLGVAGLVFAAVVFIVGFSAPAWADRSGLWMSCTSSRCSSNMGGGSDWLNATRAMEVIALVGILVSLGLELYQDVYTTPPRKDNKLVEIFGILGGVAGLIGVIVYGAKLSGQYIGYYNYNYNDNNYNYNYYYYKPDLNWGYGLTVTGLILCLACSAVIAFSRVRHAPITNQALASLGVDVTTARNPCNPHNAMPMQPMQPMQPFTTMQGNTMTAYPYPYPSAYPYPYPTAPAMMPPAVPAPQGFAAPQALANGGGVSGVDQTPSCYVMVRGQMVPVYKDMPTSIISTAPTPAPAPASAPTPAANGNSTLQPATLEDGVSSQRM